MRRKKIPLSPIPLWHRISSQAQQGLARFQYETYGLRLDIPSEPSPINIFPLRYLPSEEADKIMRQKPAHPRKVK